MASPTVQSPSLLSPPVASSSRKLSFGPTPRNNPLTLRLYKILGSSYTDSATQEALTTVSEFYASPDGTGDTAAKARKSLRKDTEERLAAGSKQFLDAFGEVNEKLNVLQEHVTEMHTRCDDAQAQLQGAQVSCKHLLEMSSSLLSQRQATATKQALIGLFLSRFTLTEAEVEALTSRDVPVGHRVFSALDSATRIREECAVLLTGEDGGTRAGTDIMATTSELLEKGYEKIARWCEYELRVLGREPQVDVDDVIREAVRRLRVRQDLLDVALTTFIETRRAHLLSSFLSALTRGEGGLTTPKSAATPRPIELHAHDPTRYIGDMLAWMHGAVAGERESLEGLFGIEEGRWVGQVKQGSKEVGRLVDETLTRTHAPLKVRVQQTIRSQESPLVTYKLYNLLQFYTLIISQTVGANSSIVALLRELTADSYAIFFESLAAQGRSLLRFLHPPEPDLSPPLELRSASHVLREIIEVYTSALVPPPSVTSASVTEEKLQTPGFEDVLDAALGPMQEMCKRVGDLGGGGWEGKVFSVNCLVYLQGVLAPFEVAERKVKENEVKVEQLVNELVDDHYAKTLKTSGLAPILEAMETKDASAPLSHLPAASPQALTAALTLFAQFLASPLLPPALLPPHLSLLIQYRALEQLEQGYARICEEVRNPDNRYEAGETMLGGRRPWGDRRVLRQVLGLGAGDETPRA